MEDIKQQLCTSVMKGDWKKAKEIYGEHREQEIQGVKITLLGDTALHMAVNTNIWENVDGLLHNQSNDVVLVDNKRNTPLHHAAKLGNERMCFEIARKQRHLLEERNANHETPLFMAAQHGQIKGFIILSVICCSLKDGYKKIYETGRRSRDGRTVLHCAIHGEYFDLNQLKANYTYANQVALRATLRYKHRDWTELLGVEPFYRYSSRRKSKVTDFLLESSSEPDLNLPQIDLISLTEEQEMAKKRVAMQKSHVVHQRVFELRKIARVVTADGEAKDTELKVLKGTLAELRVENKELAEQVHNAKEAKQKALAEKKDPAEKLGQAPGSEIFLNPPPHYIPSYMAVYAIAMQQKFLQVEEEDSVAPINVPPAAADLACQSSLPTRPELPSPTEPILIIEWGITNLPRKNDAGANLPRGEVGADPETELDNLFASRCHYLAYQIIGRFPGFIHLVDNRGNSAIHILASKHAAFTSSSRRTWLQRFIYGYSITITRTIRDLPAPGTDVENPPASSDPPRKESQRRRRNVRGLLLICLLKLIGLVCFG
ncbi:hypothetical protein TEA_017893 [Camellia sinensis var. sinensis]|uniref:Uncharacterized protein n=1 Tax=Camellia sinensis var. sinensis TaxID=542762 RepID=A0A4V3WMK0_CAMSN|nr:hypothetical protein TEA_017893 [Camellia sinensis var. sinensis]